jgi:hypothetical protein
MYKHIQIGYAAIVIVFAVILGIFAKAAFESRVGFDWKLHTIAGIAIVAIGGLFSSLTIRVENGRLSWHFAIPAVRNSIPLKDIMSVEIVRNPLIYGWGMHMIRRGWVYNVSGRGAVEVNLHDGTRLRLGTDEPEALIRAITQQGIPSRAVHGRNSRSPESEVIPVTF